MSKAARFSQADLTRAVKAFEKAGLCVRKARIDPNGAIELVAGEPEPSSNSNFFAGGPLYRDVA